MNIVILAGRLGADPELKYSNSGTAILRLRLATEGFRKTRDGQGEKTVQWHSVVVFGNRAEALNKILQKGGGVTIRGEIQYRQWEDQQGGKRYATDIVALDVELGARPSQGTNRGGGEREERRDDRDDFGDAAGAYGGDFGEDDIPF